MKKYNKIIITGANSPYFESLLTLISSLHLNSFDSYDKILVYNFGLSEYELDFLGKLKKVEVIEIIEKLKLEVPFFENMSSVKTKCHLQKMFTLYDSINLSDYFIWIDAGAMCLKDINVIFDSLVKDDIFLVGDSHLNINYTHKVCQEIMSATSEELNDKQIWSGLVGVKSEGKFKELILKGWDYSCVEGCIDGYEENHRHDQSVLSILSSRYSCKLQDIDLFGYWTDSYRNLERAKEIGSVIFVHRRGHNDKTNLIYEN
jgi:hypothetical protein